ncbi:DUF7859 family protein [Halogeometricum limi]|uniref:Uncharacterized protein n=1 Tax=Halogeometricum limi TaxID=555875 RepID=A0A1I6FVQ1_9EURY|nr:hypothetical protein [Halogeometricum limi]SFR33978.1 hypothetical protein SAMN04488124_0387 [Halogeometricum limi]
MSARPLQGLLDGFVEFVLSEPIFVGFLLLLLAFVFFAYLFIRRTLTGMRQGFDEGYRGK